METKISFQECPNSPVKVTLPSGVYEISESTKSSLDSDQSSDEFIYNRSDRCIILNFKWETPQYYLDQSSKSKTLIIRFKIKAAYVRLEPKNLEYISEIKFKIQN